MPSRVGESSTHPSSTAAPTAATTAAPIRAKRSIASVLFEGGIQTASVRTIAAPDATSRQPERTTNPTAVATRRTGPSGVADETRGRQHAKANG